MILLLIAGFARTLNPEALLWIGVPGLLGLWTCFSMVTLARHDPLVRLVGGFWLALLPLVCGCRRDPSQSRPGAPA